MAIRAIFIIIVFSSLYGCATVKSIFTKKEETFSVENIIGQDKEYALANFDKLGKAIKQSNDAQMPSPPSSVDGSKPVAEIPKIQSQVYGVNVGSALFNNSSENEMVYVLYGRDEYHKRSCPELGKAKNGSSFPIPLSKAKKAYTPCPICNP